MIYDYIAVDIKAVTNDYLVKIRPDYEMHKRHLTLLYKISLDAYYISLYSTKVWDALICETQEEFINTVAQHKLERIL